MALSIETHRVSFTGDAVRTEFPTLFKFFASSDLVVTIQENGSELAVTQSLGTHYTVTGAGEDAGGDVTFLSAPPADSIIVIKSDIPYTQPTSFRTAGTFSPATHENQFDKVVRMAQQLDGRVTDLEAGEASPDAEAGAGLVVNGSTWDIGVGDGIVANDDDIEIDFYGSTPATLVPDGAGTDGSSAQVSRGDHNHPIACAAPSALAIGNTASEGVSTSFARADHQHALTAGTPVNVTKAANSEGVATTFARSDHKHDITTAAPSSIGTANSEGSASTVARSDHVHNHGAQTDGTHHAVATSSTAGFMSAADKTKLDLMGRTSGSVQTSDATVTTLKRIDLTNNKTYLFDIHVVARRTSGGNEGAGYQVAATFRNDSGTVTQVGTTTAVATHEDVAGWAVTLAISGTFVDVKVTGVAAVTIDWVGVIDYILAP